MRRRMEVQTAACHLAHGVHLVHQLLEAVARRRLVQTPSHAGCLVDDAVDVVLQGLAHVVGHSRQIPVHVPYTVHTKHRHAVNSTKYEVNSAQSSVHSCPQFTVYSTVRSQVHRVVASIKRWRHPKDPTNLARTLAEPCGVCTQSEILQRLLRHVDEARLAGRLPSGLEHESFLVPVLQRRFDCIERMFSLSKANCPAMRLFDRQ
jgi:hypothetical protein